MYHYVIWGKRMPGDDSGETDMPRVAEFLPADDSLVALDNTPYTSPRSRAEVLAHELGHQFAQKHGGADDEWLSPNYWSVMSYTWVGRTNLQAADRKKSLTCFPFYYANAGEKEIGNQPPGSVNMIVQFSAGMARQVVENNSSLDENTGICNQELDWNGDGLPPSPTPLNNVDVNDNASSSDTINDFANWPALRFDGPRKNGTLGP
jgi:hypothetical protein